MGPDAFTNTRTVTTRRNKTAITVCLLRGQCQAFSDKTFNLLVMIYMKLVAARMILMTSPVFRNMDKYPAATIITVSPANEYKTG
jgi:hypothetical protein